MYSYAVFSQELSSSKEHHLTVKTACWHVGIQTVLGFVSHDSS